MAIGGFTCALIGLFLPCMVVDLLISAVGLVLSIVGAKQKKLRGLAVAGIVIGVLGVIGAISLLVLEPEFYTR